MEQQSQNSFQDAPSARGELKIFIGMCAGVGKTYAMLQEAKQKLSEGVDVVIGFAETHGRKETEALLEGIEVIPLMEVEYRGIKLKEMDLDAILKRKPAIVIIDELPHTNAVKCRHAKRYQDVIEILDAGISVYTALNVQHIESRTDVIQSIVNIKVREKVPDSVIDLAEDVRLIDITPDDLLVRLSEGKVYIGEQAATAADNFFRIENLFALREIAVRIMAEKTGQDVRETMAGQNIQGPWKSSERYMVAVGPSPFSGYLIRWTRRISAATNSTWIAVYVDTLVPLSKEEKQRLTRNLSLVRRLGGEAVTIVDEDIACGLLKTAKEQSVTQIVIGKPLESSLVRMFTGRSLVDKIILESGDIDVCVVRAEKKVARKKPASGKQPASLQLFHEYASGFGIIAIITLVFLFLRNFTSFSTIALLYLLSIVILATKLHRQVILAIAIATGFVWNFLFIPPVLTFRIGSFSDILMFCMYIVVALVIGHLTTRLRLREINERMQVRRTGILYQLAQCVVESRNLDEGIELAVTQIDSVFGCRTAVNLVNENRSLSIESHPASSRKLDEKELSVAAWVHSAGKPAGRFTDTLQDSVGIHVPLVTTHGNAGVLTLFLPQKSVLDVNEMALLDTIADQVAALVDRYNLIRQANRVSIIEESEKQYHVLFDCVSHELKTPLSILSAAADQIGNFVNRGNIQQALVTNDESKVAINRLKRSVDNLLSMTRMESGHGTSETVFCDLEEIVETAYEQVSDLLRNHDIHVSIPEMLPLVEADPVLLTHVIANLLINAAQYSPKDTRITVTAAKDAGWIILKVIDEGEGIPDDELSVRLFEKFHRGKNARSGGTGLGLSIVKRFMEIIGGSTTAENNPDGKGAVFTLYFPVKQL